MNLQILVCYTDILIEQYSKPRKIGLTIIKTCA